jgi:hypothetical protein
MEAFATFCDVLSGCENLLGYAQREKDKQKAKQGGR